MKLVTLWLAVVLAVGCGNKSSTSTTPPPAPTEPTGSADPAPTEPVGKTKCEQEGGVCQSKVATTACKRFEEAAEWGCTAPDSGCCLNN